MFSQITPELFVSDEYRACNYQLIDEFKIRSFLRLDKDALHRESWREQGERFFYHTEHLIDGVGNDAKTFINAVRWLQGQSEKSLTPTLVYCMAAQNRSPLICALYLYAQKYPIVTTRAPLTRQSETTFTTATSLEYFNQYFEYVRSQHMSTNPDSEIANYAREFVVPLL